MKRPIVMWSTLVTLSIVVLLVVEFPNSAQTPVSSILVKTVEGNWIVRLNMATGEEERIYHSNKGRAHTIAVSPDNRYISFIEETELERTRDGAYVVTPRRDLVLLDGTGKVIARIEDKDVRRYVWNPSGDKIAFLSFQPCDSDYEFRCPTGAWVFDLNTSELVKIKERATEINWAVFDSAVYLYDNSEVVKWHPEAKTPVITDHKDILFSPDGKYYLRLWKDEGKPIQLYETNSNEELFAIKVYEGLLPPGISAVPFPADIGELWSSHDLEAPYGWVFNSGHLLLFTKVDAIVETAGEGPVKAVKSIEVRSVKNFVYDPEQRKVVKEFEGAISSWIGDGSRIIVEKDDKVLFEDIR